MIKLLALSIGGNHVTAPGQVTALTYFSFNYIIQWAITLVLSITVLLSFIFFLVGGVKWIASQGDKKQVEEAQKTITYAIVGLLVVFFSFFIINLIGYAFGVPLIGNPITGR